MRRLGLKLVVLESSNGLLSMLRDWLSDQQLLPNNGQILDDCFHSLPLPFVPVVDGGHHTLLPQEIIDFWWGQFGFEEI